MKRSFAVVTLVILALAVSVPLAWSQGGNAEQQIKKVADEVNAAMLKADTNSLDKLLADDYTAIHSDGKLYTKAQEIEYVKSGVLKYETVDVKDMKIRAYGKTAVVTGLVFFKGSINGNPYSGTNRPTRVWMKQNGTWKCVSYQVTRVSQ
jgi:hypothetical protein